MLNQTLKSWELTKWSPTKSLIFSAADFWDPEAYCSKEESLTLLKKITFYSHANETRFQNGGFEICLIPTMRVLRTWKWSFWVCFILEKNVWRLTRFLRSPNKFYKHDTSAKKIKHSPEWFCFLFRAFLLLLVVAVILDVTWEWTIG